MKFCKSTLVLVFLLAVGSDIAAQDVNQSPLSAPLFKCGPGFTTYSVKSLNGVEGEGVRCVIIDHLGKVEGKYLSGVYWYGEGTWNGKQYRHIGCTYSRQGFQSFVTDIFGNGESSHNEVSSLLLTSSDKLHHIRVTGGGWNEEWIREPDGEADSYRSTLNKVTNCGDHLEKASVTEPDSPTSEVVVSSAIPHHLCRTSGMAKEYGTVNNTAISDLSLKALIRYQEQLPISAITLKTLAVKLQKTGLPSQLKWTAGKRVHIW
jgi:hypothetical protein